MVPGSPAGARTSPSLNWSTGRSRESWTTSDLKKVSQRRHGEMRKILLAVLFAVSTITFAQDPKSQQDAKPAPEAKPPEIHAQAGEAVAPKQQPEAKPADVDTIGHLMAAVYDVISGPQGD